MINIRIIERGINVKPLLDEVLSLSPESWVRHSKDKTHYVVPLTVPVVYAGQDTSILNSNETINTRQYYKCPTILNWMRRRNFYHHAWAGIYRLPPGGNVPPHKDDSGDYYMDKMRYHLCLQGKYLYKVEGDPVYTITPGTLFWFDLQTTHSAECVSDDDRITLLFDLANPDSLINP
jgi:hypothetical protein